MITELNNVQKENEIQETLSYDLDVSGVVLWILVILVAFTTQSKIHK